MIKIFIKKIVVGNNRTNCYVIGEKKGTGMVIDPGAEPAKILKEIDKVSINIIKIINTHGHFDHIAGNEVIKQNTGAILLISNQEKDFLRKPEKNLSSFLGENREIISPEADELLYDGDIIELNSYKYYIINTPGHSPGSISLYNQENGILFSGDTVFNMGIGRTDFPGCNQENLYKSISEKLLPLPESTVVYPGHGIKTTLAEFKDNVWKQL